MGRGDGPAPSGVDTFESRAHVPSRYFVNTITSASIVMLGRRIFPCEPKEHSFVKKGERRTRRQKSNRHC